MRALGIRLQHLRVLTAAIREALATDSNLSMADEISVTHAMQEDDSGMTA